MNHNAEDELRNLVHREVTDAAHKQIHAAYRGDVNPIDTFANTESIMSLIAQHDQQLITRLMERMPEKDRYKLSPYERKPYATSNGGMSNIYSNDYINDGWNKYHDAMAKVLEEELANPKRGGSN